MSSNLSKFVIFSAEAIIASGSAEWSVDLDRYNAEGFFSLQATITGNGTAQFTYKVSNNASDYITPTGTAAIINSLTKTGGPGADGKDFASFDPPVCRNLKIICTETGGANSITVSAWLVIQ